MKPRKAASIELLLVLFCLGCMPLLAQAQDIAPISSTLTAILSFLQGTMSRTLAGIAVACLGILAMMGRMRWAWAGSIIGGIVLIFGAAAIVSFFTTSAGS
jgi:type IV secretion system protein VirB2